MAVAKKMLGRGLLFALGLTLSTIAGAEPVRVVKKEGVVHGFLVLRSASGEVIADGDLLQVPHGKTIDSRLVFHFRDGSLHDERVVFAQEDAFELVSYHLVQKGPSFPEFLTAHLERSGRYEVRHREDEETEEERLEGDLELPNDVYNGMFFTLLKNLEPGAGRKVSMVAFTPEPRLVELHISSSGEEPFSIGKSARTATRYVMKIDIGGLTGFLAELFGKEPPPLNVWMLGGEAPAFLRFRGFLYQGGPEWTIELTKPQWSDEPPP